MKDSEISKITLGGKRSGRRGYKVRDQQGNTCKRKNRGGKSQKGLKGAVTGKKKGKKLARRKGGDVAQEGRPGSNGGSSKKKCRKEKAPQ